MIFQKNVLNNLSQVKFKDNKAFQKKEFVMLTWYLEKLMLHSSHRDILAAATAAAAAAAAACFCCVWKNSIWKNKTTNADANK